MFSNNESGTEVSADSEHLPNKILAHNAIFSQIGNHIETYYISPFTECFADTVEGICKHIKTLCGEDYPTINNALIRHICIEPRCCSMYIKVEYRAEFADMFAAVFGAKFKLYTHAEFIESGLLGTGIPHKKKDEMTVPLIVIEKEQTI